MSGLRQQQLLLAPPSGDQADRLAVQATITSGLRLGRSKVLRSLRHYPVRARASCHAIDRLEERGVERGSARRSSFDRTREGHRQSDDLPLTGRERAIVNQTIFLRQDERGPSSIRRSSFERTREGHRQSDDLPLKGRERAIVSQTIFL